MLKNQGSDDGNFDKWPSAFNSVFDVERPEPSSQRSSDLDTPTGLGRRSLLDAVKQSATRAAEVVFAPHPSLVNKPSEQPLKDWIGAQAKATTHSVCMIIWLGVGGVAAAYTVGTALSISQGLYEAAKSEAAMAFILTAASCSFWKWGASLSDQLREAKNKSSNDVSNNRVS